MSSPAPESAILYEVPWIKETLQGASSLISSGVDVEFVILIVVLVPVVLRALQLAELYVRTHTLDLRETIRLEAMRERLALRREYGELYDREKELEIPEDD